MKPGEEAILCHKKGNESRKLRFRPTSHQVMSLPFLGDADYPYDFRVTRTPSNNLWVLIKPVTVRLFKWGEEYRFKIGSGGKNQSFNTAAKKLLQELVEYSQEESNRLHVVPQSDITKVEEIFQRTDYYDLAEVEDVRPYLVYSSARREPKKSWIDPWGKRKQWLLSDVAVGVRVEKGKKIFLMDSKRTANYVVTEYKVKKL